MTSKLKNYFLDYESYHRNSHNKYTHYIGIPLIVLSIFALPLAITLLLWCAASFWYMKIGGRTGLIFSILLCVFFIIGQTLSPLLAVSLFLMGWGFQLIGHVFEGQSPAFTKNAEHLLIGPLWIFCKLFNLHDKKTMPESLGH